jgi:hypothetical protein
MNGASPCNGCFLEWLRQLARPIKHTFVIHRERCVGPIVTMDAATSAHAAAPSADTSPAASTIETQVTRQAVPPQPTLPHKIIAPTRTGPSDPSRKRRAGSRSASPTPPHDGDPKQHPTHGKGKKKARGDRYKKSSMQRSSVGAVLTSVDPKAVLSEKARPSLSNVCDGVIVGVITAVLESRPLTERGLPVTAAEIALAVRECPHLARFLPALTNAPEISELHPALCSSRGDADGHEALAGHASHKDRSVHPAFWL